jgi:hypothetical protein
MSGIVVFPPFLNTFFLSLLLPHLMSDDDFESPPSTAPPQRNAQWHVLRMFDDLRRSRPQHPMFGEPVVGQLRLPYSSSRSNGVSWVNLIRNMIKPSYRWSADDCWMTKSDCIKVTRAGVLCKSVKVVRFLAFLKSPTDENWQALVSGQRGERTDGEQEGFVCINGIFHGDFSTRDVNESRKACKNGAACLCPHRPRCIFTHGDGTSKKCRNLLDCVPLCACQQKKCF